MDGTDMLAAPSQQPTGDPTVASPEVAMLVASLREVQLQLQQQQGEMTQLRTHNAQLEERLMSTLAATEANIDPMPGTTTASHPGTQIPLHLTQGGVPQGGLSFGAPDRGFAASGYSGRYSIKINEPKEFRGGPRTDVREWVMDVKDYIGFHTLRGPPLGENEKVLITATWLAGDAKIRWTAERQKLEKIQAADPTHPALNFTLEGFLEWIQREFKDINREEKDRSAYVRCVQGTRTVAQYVTDFLSKAARVVPPPTSLDQRDRFKDELSPLMRKEMARVRPTPIDAREYMRIAEELDQTIRSVERSERYAGSDRHGRSLGPVILRVNAAPDFLGSIPVTRSA
ncbi:hypothetical protein CF319_g1419 [Tilletia indica]|nr:hypothetical protein CF319_g1419 [Tilletia indica]